MSEFENKTNINEKVGQDFLRYANAVIKSRAISSVEDNLKPVHRRILFAMANEKLWSNKKHVKSAKVTGSVIANTHPHGDAAVYDAMIRLAQPWKMRYPLIDVQGNAGNILGDGPAAARYTEVKLSPFGDLMLDELNSGAVLFKPNYDNTSEEPIFLASKFPNILANGNTGIAVGLGASLVPHNLKDIVSAITQVIDKPATSAAQLATLIKAPDFPTGGVILDAEKLPEIYSTGKGTITLRCKYTVENISKTNPPQQQIRVTEIPYLVSIRSGVIEPLKKLVVEEGFDLIEDIQDETNMDGVNLKIILKKGANIYKVLDTLWAKTRLQITQRIDNTLIIEGNPKTLSLRQMIDNYISHRHSCIIRITRSDLSKTQNKILITQGLITALDKINEVVELIKNAENRSAAKNGLIKLLSIVDIQADAILDMKLSRLSRLDSIELKADLTTLQKKEKELEEILSNPTKRNSLIKSQLYKLSQDHGDQRRTEINFSLGNAAVDAEQPITTLNIAVTRDGIIFPTTKTFELITATKGAPLLSHPLAAALTTTSDKTLMLFTSNGEVHQRKISTLNLDTPEKLDIGEVIAALDPTSGSNPTSTLLFITSEGVVKRSNLSEYTTIKSKSKAIKLRENDSVIFVGISNTPNTDYVLILGKKGGLVKLLVDDIPSTGKLTIGSKGITDQAISAALCSEQDKLFTVNSSGQGKLTNISDYIINARGASGQSITPNTILIAKSNSNFAIIYSNKKNHFINISKISTLGKTATGAKLIRTTPNYLV